MAPRFLPIDGALRTESSLAEGLDHHRLGSGAEGLRPTLWAHQPCTNKQSQDAAIAGKRPGFSQVIGQTAAVGSQKSSASDIR